MRESPSILDRPTEVPRMPGAGSGSHPRSTSMSAMLRYDGAGLVGAIALFCLSLTPSLLPRSWLAQGLISGFLAAVGYGPAVRLGRLVRAVIPAGAATTMWKT